MTSQPRRPRSAAGARARRAGVSLAFAVALLAPSAAGAPLADSAPLAEHAPTVAGAASPLGAPGPPGSPVAAAEDDRTPPYPELLPRTIGEAPLTLALGRLTPAIATPDTPVTLDVTITNHGLTAATPTLLARVGAPLVARADLDAPIDLAAARPATDGVPVAALAPGATTTARLTIPADRAAPDAPYGVLPLLITAQQGPTAATIRTFLPFERRKEYEALEFAVAVPLTPGPDPALTGASPGGTEAAWAKATGPGSRLDRILAGTAGAAVTYAVDPAVLGPPAAGAPAPSPAPPSTPAGAPSPGPAGSASTGPAPTSSAPGGPASPTPPVSPARDAYAARLAALARAHPLWALPAEDPDVAELQRAGLAPATLPRLLAADPRFARRLPNVPVPRVAWPPTALDSGQVRQLSSAFGPSWTGPLVLPLADSQEPGWTGDAARRFGDGPSVLAYDEVLSRLIANAAGAPASAGPGLAQRFLAESMTILQEYPGRPRRLLAVAPRDLDPDPTTLAALLHTAATTPWLRTVSTDTLLRAARDPGAPAALAPENPTARPAPFPPAGSPLDMARVDAVEADLRRLDGLAQVLPAESAIPAAARGAMTSLLSTRWRGQEEPWEAARTAAHARVDSLLSGVSVVDSQVNFFADSGTLQVTVINTLDVDVRDVQLRLVPQGRMPRLRLPSTPYAVAIAAHSRATVKVPVEALAAGPTVVSAQVTSPDGTRLGAQDATLTVQVQPSTGWLVLGIGGATGAIFLIGLFRTIRRNRPRVSAQDLEEIDLE